MHILRKTALVAGLIGSFFVQGSEFGGKSIDIPMASITPEIDGEFNLSEWQDAHTLNDMTERYPKYGRAPIHDTQFYVKYDKHFLYIAAVMQQDPSTVVANQLVQGKSMWDDDYVGVIIDPTNDKSDAYLFHVSPNGIREDGLVENRSYIGEWQGIWLAQSQITENGWVSEIAIPVQTISFDKNVSDWGMQFRRKVSTPMRQYFWNLNEPGVSGWSARQVGTASGIKDMDPGMGADIRPSIAVKDRSFSDDNDVKTLNPSIDAFYKITPSLTAAVTINTDFSGTDVDDQQVNLSRFSLFLPEKRDFFLQDAGIFEFGGLLRNGRPFFSRTIGLSDEGQPLDIEFGGKLTGKVGDFNLGVLSVQQTSGVDPQDATNVTVARTRYHYGDDAYVGVIATHGSPNSEHQDSLFGMDYRQSFSLGDGNIIEANAWWQQANQHDVRDDNQAYGFQVEYPSNTLWAKLEHKQIQKNFAPALGFVNRNDIKDTELNMRYRLTPDSSDTFTFLQASGTYSHITNTQGKKLSERLEIRPMQMEFTSNDFFMVKAMKRYEYVESAFTLADVQEIAAGDYDFDRYAMFYNGDDSRLLNVRVYYEWGDYFNGKKKQLGVTSYLRPNKHLYLSLYQGLNFMEFGETKFETRVHRINVNVAPNGFWAWTNTIQYDNVSDSASLFSRLKYEPQAGETYQLVLQRGYDVDDEARRFQVNAQEVALKAGYTYRF